MHPLLITPGDAAGIGPEVALRAANILDGRYPLAFVGPAWLWQNTAKLFSLPVPSQIIAVESLQSFSTVDISFGELSPSFGTIAVESSKKAATLCLAGKAAGIVTAPLTKAGIHAAGYSYAGHTDLLADITATPVHAMMMSGNKLRVVLVTHHQSLASVPAALSSDSILSVIRLGHEAGMHLNLPAPRIAVCGLNPHCGEDDAFGSEERTILIPAIKEAVSRSINASGPYPADSIFQRAQRNEFDFVIALYHDQGLIPVKLAGFSDVVNTTLGLPFVRTSPGHGSAYDIAGTGHANPSSMLAAIEMAAALTTV